MNIFTRWMLGIVVLALIIYSCCRFWHVNAQLESAQEAVSRMRLEEEELLLSGQILFVGPFPENSGE